MITETITMNKKSRFFEVLTLPAMVPGWGEEAWSVGGSEASDDGIGINVHP
jgi:hypothetical protein